MGLLSFAPSPHSSVSNFTSFRPYISEIEDECVVEIARTPKQIHAAHLLRHQVYCIERNYERGCRIGDDEIEIDQFDAHARHVILTNRRNGEVVGTVRLVVADPARLGCTFPMQHVCPSLHHYVPISRSAEVSRFAISKLRRLPLPLMRLSLMRGMAELSMELGLTHWCATMEPALLRLLKATGIHFRSIGGLVEHHGLRQPCYNSIDEIARGVERQIPELYDFFTDDGRVYPSRALREDWQNVPVADQRGQRAA
jgi:N-acyl-L-homoserine lactone synthetase